VDNPKTAMCEIVQGNSNGTKATTLFTGPNAKSCILATTSADKVVVPSPSKSSKPAVKGGSSSAAFRASPASIDAAVMAGFAALLILFHVL
jgi:hypothetical protein